MFCSLFSQYILEQKPDNENKSELQDYAWQILTTAICPSNMFRNTLRVLSGFIVGWEQQCTDLDWTPSNNCLALDT